MRKYRPVEVNYIVEKSYAQYSFHMLLSPAILDNMDQKNVYGTKNIYIYKLLGNYSVRKLINVNTMSYFQI
jgi:hypothetical protein